MFVTQYVRGSAQIRITRYMYNPMVWVQVAHVHNTSVYFHVYHHKILMVASNWPCLAFHCLSSKVAVVTQSPALPLVCTDVLERCLRENVHIQLP